MPVGSLRRTIDCILPLPRSTPQRACQDRHAAPARRARTADAGVSIADSPTPLIRHFRDAADRCRPTPCHCSTPRAAVRARPLETRDYQTSFATRSWSLATVRARLGERRAARSTLHTHRANEMILAAYSGPTSRPLPGRGTIVLRTVRWEEWRHRPIRCCFGSSRSSGLRGSRCLATPNSAAKPSASARIQLSSSLTGIRMLTRGASLRPPTMRRISSEAHGPSSRSRKTSQLSAAPERLSSVIRVSSLDLPPATRVGRGTGPTKRISFSAIGASVTPSTA